ncbi:transforming growth factor-beta-induced protein ig-h3-like [Macrobrachium rosenbergii]
MSPLRIVLAVFCGVLVVARGERQGKFFDASFTADGDTYKWRADLNMDQLGKTVDSLVSSFDTALDNLSETIERQVDSSLPLWMRPHQNVEDIGAISGSLGDGIDDGLKVFFKDRVDGERVEEPEAEVETGFDPTRRTGVTPPNNRPGFGSSFPFNPFFPFSGFNRGSGFNLFSNRRGYWWKGPNVCVDREEVDEGIDSTDDTTLESSGPSFAFSLGHMEMTTCRDTASTYTCTTKTSRRGIHKTVTLTYKCCHGYIKEPSGCTKIEMRSMPDTLDDIGSTDFLSMTRSAGMEEVMTAQNLTIFAPTNEAMQEFTADLEEETEIDNGLEVDRSLNEVYLRRQRSLDAHDMVLAHMTKGFHYASDLHDEQVLQSLADNSTLRINTYSTVPPSATVNCARLISINQHSSNGVVHTIDRVLRPVTRSLAELVAADPQFSILKQLISNAGMLPKLREPGQLTLFAPTDAAFRTLPEPLLESLLEGNACLDSILKNHVLPNVICSAAVQQGKARTANLLDSYLLLERTDDDKMLASAAQIVAKDVVATNGVMHVVDAPLMPQEAKPVRKVLESHNLTRFMDLLEIAGMSEEMDSLNDVTIFAPSNAAIDSIPEDAKLKILDDPQQLRNILNYHIVTPSLKGDDINNNHIADTRADMPIRINLYPRTPLLTGLILGPGGRRSVRLTAGCSPVSTLDSRACGAVVHVVERLFVIPQETVMDHLEDSGDFSIFTQMVKKTGVNETLVQEGPFTVLAPSDHVFRTLPKNELDHLMEDTDLQEQLVKLHVLNEHVCCAGINPNTWLFMDHKRTLDGHSSVHVRRTGTGRLMAGPARITHCSAPTRNGLVHTVNQLFMNVNPNKNGSGSVGPLGGSPGSSLGTRRPIFSAPGLEILFG